jgi:7-carboxy-7-deazaguanine synthase
MPLTLIEQKPTFDKKVEGEDKLAISEMFSDTLQGEGPNVGIVSTFMRLQGCTLKCVWCDTLDVWPHGNEYSFEEIFEMWEKVGLIDRLEKGQHLILTGGSPLKQEKRLFNFIVQFIQRYGFKPYIEVENEAVLMPSQQFVDIVDWWNNSPKLANSGMKPRVRIKPDVLTFMGELPNSIFKFVVASDQDWEEIQTDFINPGFIAKNKIVIMPEGQTQEELSKTREMAADMAIKHGVRFTDRLHVTIWNKKTGV